MNRINMGDITRNTLSRDTCVTTLKQCKIQNHATVLTVICISYYIHLLKNSTAHVVSSLNSDIGEP